jgi:hypothetical protein
MEFKFDFFDIHMNIKRTTSHDCCAFKWQNINRSLISNHYYYHSMAFLFLLNLFWFFNSTDHKHEIIDNIFLNPKCYCYEYGC